MMFRLDLFGFGDGNMRNKFDNIILLYAALSLSASCVVGKIGFVLLARFPSFDDVSCQGQRASGCLEWSLVLFGPLYLAFYILIYAMVVTAALAPLSFGLLLILRRMKAHKKTQ